MLLTRVCPLSVFVQFVYQVGAARRVRSAALASTVWVEMALCAPAAQVEISILEWSAAGSSSCDLCSKYLLRDGTLRAMGLGCQCCMTGG